MDCNKIMQPNPGHGIMVTFKMVSSIAYVDTIIYICFVDGVVPDRRIDLECLEARYESGFAGTSIPERSRK